MGAVESKLQLGHCEAQGFEGGFELDYQLRLEAPRERVFQALTTEVNRWWPHTYSETPLRIELESRIGGRFMELFDETGRGVLYGFVEVYDPPQALRIRGAVGMSRAVNVFWTVTLEETADGSTLLHERCRVSGDVSEKLQSGMARGTEEEYGEHLRNWVEQGKALRG